MSWEVPGYTAEELVGFGATGEVWRGRETATGELVALKRLRVADPDSCARLRREAALLAHLEHPHLLRLRETVTTGEESVLVLEYAAGGSLAALLRRRRRLRPGEVVTAVAPIAAALAYVHGDGLVHGDVTASNVLLTADGRPLLADLGMARIGGETGAVHATPEYADPVVARGSAPAAASDVFAAAAVAYHALTGVAPWSAPTAEEALALAAAGERAAVRELAPEVPGAMAEAIERALAVDPAARGTAAQFALELRHSCPPEPIQLPGSATVTAVPESARPVSMTHAIRARPRSAATTAATSSASDGPRHALHRIWRVVRSPGLRAAVLAVVSIAVAVRLGVAWAGSDAQDIAQRRAADPGTAGTGSASVPPQSGGPQLEGPQLEGSRSSGDGTRSTPPRGSQASRTDWIQVLTDLDERRATAFAAADPAPLRQVYVVGSNALSKDVAQVRRLTQQAMSADGVRHDISAVRVQERQADRVVLRVTESLRSYQIRAGVRRRQAPGGAARQYRITLQKSGAGWRIQQMTAEGEAMQD